MGADNLVLDTASIFDGSDPGETLRAFREKLEIERAVV
jgi:hypothetical protein